MFEPLAADQEVPLVAGAQGGYHVWLSMRASGLCAGRNDVRLEVIPSGSARESQSNVRMAFTQVEGEPGVVEQIGWPARVLEPWCAVGDPVRLSVTVTDADGQSAKAAIDVMPVAPAGGFGRTCESP